MPTSRAQFKVIAGPNEGDTIRLDLGSCRLIGRHLSETETSLIDRDGNRTLDATANELFMEHLGDADEAAKPRAVNGHQAAGGRQKLNAFERGPDVIFQDDAISRAHAMLFFGATGVGLIDLASTNGTFVNNERAVSVMLSDGDVVALGDSEMTVSLRRG